jgi:hypothetical protein
VIDSSLGDMASDTLEALVRDNLDGLAQMLPPLQLPVALEQSIAIDGLKEGVVTVAAGTLPLEMSLAEVIPVSERLWLLLDVKAGPWSGAQTADAKVAEARAAEAKAGKAGKAQGKVAEAAR